MKFSACSLPLASSGNQSKTTLVVISNHRILCVDMEHGKLPDLRWVARLDDVKRPFIEQREFRRGLALSILVRGRGLGENKGSVDHFFIKFCY